MVARPRARGADALLTFTRSLGLALLVSTGLAVQAWSQAPTPLPPGGFRLSPAQAGLIGLALAASYGADNAIRDLMQDNREDTGGPAVAFGNALGNGRYVLPVLGAGYVAGIVSAEPGVSRAALRASEAFVLAGGAATLLKEVGGRSRPVDGGDADDFRLFGGGDSFPSGHAAVAFGLASALAAETPNRLVHVGLYGAAGLTAFARLHDDKHWASDVIAGALIGQLAGRWVTRHDRLPVQIGPSPSGVAIEVQLSR